MSAIELYEFSLYSAVWRYTSADVAYVADGHMFAPLPGLSRGVVERSGDASRTEHKVTCPVGVGPAALFATGTPDGVLRLRILRLEAGSASVVWMGRVLGCESAGVTATLTCEPVFSTVKAPGLSQMFTPSCPHDFGDKHCQPPDNNGNYSELNRSYASGAAAAFQAGTYFHTGTDSAENPPERIWDQDPASFGEVLESGSGDWTARYKDQFFEQEIEGCMHTFEIYEILWYEEGVLTYGYESYEYWECPEYEEIYTSYTATEDAGGVAHYVQTDPEPNTWDDPAGLPTLDDYTDIDYGPGLYRAGITFAEAQDVAKVAFLYLDEGRGAQSFIAQHSDDGETWTTADLVHGSPVSSSPQAEWQELLPVEASGSHLHWAICSGSPFILHGLFFLTRQEYADSKAQLIGSGTVTWEGTPASGHPVSAMMDSDRATYGELTGEGCRLIFDLGSAVNLAGISFLNAPGFGWSADGRGRLFLEFSDDGEAWSLANGPGPDRNPHEGDDPLRLFFPCNDFGAHRWWSVVSADGLIRLSEILLYKRGRLVRPDEPRPRTTWVNNSLWEIEGEILAVNGSTVTVSGIDAKADGFFAGGLLLSAAGARSILYHTGSTLTLRRAMSGLTVGLAVSVRAGCDKTKETCNSRGNIPNHGGWPFIPWKNPMSGETIY